MERYESGSIEPVGGGEPDPKSVTKVEENVYFYAEFLVYYVVAVAVLAAAAIVVPIPLTKQEG